MNIIINNSQLDSYIIYPTLLNFLIQLNYLLISVITNN